MISCNENGNSNENRSHTNDQNRPRLRYGHKMFPGMMMLICIKQYLSNIWSSIHEKVKQHLGWGEKSVAHKTTTTTRTTTTKTKRFPLLHFLTIYVHFKQ